MTNRGIGFTRWIEGQAQGVRQLAELAPSARLDPWAFAEALDVLVRFPADIPGLDPGDLEHLSSMDDRRWSGASAVLPNGVLAVLLNPLHSPARNSVTIMEEICHVYLGHKPSLSSSTADRLVIRDFRPSDEKQAYAVAAAAILPAPRLELLLSRGVGIQELAAGEGVSQPLVNYRLNVTGLRSRLRRSAV